MNDNVNLESLLYSYYIKYESLYRMSESLTNINNNINIYIDLFDMLKPLYTNNYYTNKKFLITASIINLAAHLRQYFWTRHRIWARIYFVYGTCNTNNHIQYYPEFSNNNIQNTVNFITNNQFINNQLELVKILSAYMPNVYFIKRNTHCAMFIFDDIYKKTNETAIIVSKDKYLYQLPALLNNTIIFRPKKRNGEDISYYVNNNNVFKMFYSKASPETINLLSNINTKLLSVLIALNGFPSYNMKSTMNINTAANFILNAIKDNRILNKNITDIDYLYKQLYDIEQYIDSESFKLRFYAVDLLVQFRLYNSSIESKDITWNIDLNDPNTVKNINNKYFVDVPLDLNSL